MDVECCPFLPCQPLVDARETLTPPPIFPPATLRVVLLYPPRPGQRRRRTSRLYLTEVAVRSDCRRRGVGRVLLGLVDDVAKELKTSEVGGRFGFGGGWLRLTSPLILLLCYSAFGWLYRPWLGAKWAAYLLGWAALGCFGFGFVLCSEIWNPLCSCRCSFLPVRPRFRLVYSSKCGLRGVFFWLFLLSPLVFSPPDVNGHNFSRHISKLCLF